MSDYNIKINVDVEGAKKDIQDTETKALNTKKKVEQINKESEARSDLAYIKTLQNVQKMSEIIGRSVSIFGKELSKTTKASISFATQTISTLIPILTAQSFDPFRTIQATLGLIALGQAGVQLAILISEEQKTEDIFSSVATNLGDEAWWH